MSQRVRLGLLAILLGVAAIVVATALNIGFAFDVMQRPRPVSDWIFPCMAIIVMDVVTMLMGGAAIYGGVLHLRG